MASELIEMEVGKSPTGVRVHIAHGLGEDGQIRSDGQRAALCGRAVEDLLRISVKRGISALRLEDWLVSKGGSWGQSLEGTGGTGGVKARSGGVCERCVSRLASDGDVWGGWSMRKAQILRQQREEAALAQDAVAEEAT